MRVVLPALLLAACVTHAPSPVGDTLLDHCAPPALTVALTDPDGLPRAYDDALHTALAEVIAPRAGFAQASVERAVTDSLAPRLDTYRGEAACGLRVEIHNVILPDATRFTPLSGMKSFGVVFALTDGEGTVLAETIHPFTILSDMQRSSRFGGSAWRRIGNTEDLRVEALLSLSEATAQVVGEAVTGGRTQTGMSGRLRAYPERADPDRAGRGRAGRVDAAR